MRAWACVLALCFSACAASATNSRLEDLRKAVDRYNHAFRWKAFEQASFYRLPEDRLPFVLAYEDAETLHIDEYRIAAVRIVDKHSAEVTVRSRYIEMPSTVIVKKTSTQFWRAIDGVWLLEDEDAPLRKFESEPPPVSDDAAAPVIRPPSETR